MSLQVTFRRDDGVRVMRRANPVRFARVSGTPRAVGDGDVKPVFDRADRVWVRRGLHSLRSRHLNGCDVFFNVNPVRDMGSGDRGLGGDREHLAGAARVHLDVDREAYSFMNTRGLRPRRR